MIHNEHYESLVNFSEKFFQIFYIPNSYRTEILCSRKRSVFLKVVTPLPSMKFFKSVAMAAIYFHTAMYCIIVK